MGKVEGQLCKVKVAGEVLARPSLGQKTYLEHACEEEIYAIKGQVADVGISGEVTWGKVIG